MRNRPLKDRISNDLFEVLVLTLEEINFQFIYNISKELVKNSNIKGQIYK